MKLQSYLDLKGLTHEAFGDEIGVKRLTVWRWVHNEQFPRPHHIQAIHRATDGAVTANDLYGVAA